MAPGKSRAAGIGFRVLDATTRSWGAFWATIGACVLYGLWNVIGRAPFDPYPFIFLTLLLTFFSYLQNIVIMTVQREADALANRQLLYLMHTMEAVRDALAGGMAKAADPAAGAGLDAREPPPG